MDYEQRLEMSVQRTDTRAQSPATGEFDWEASVRKQAYIRIHKVPIETSRDYVLLDYSRCGYIAVACHYPAVLDVHLSLCRQKFLEVRGSVMKQMDLQRDFNMQYRL